MSDIELGAAVAQARLQAGLTQLALAQRAATSQPAIARLERGLGSPTVATLVRLAAAVGCSLHIEFVPAPVSDAVVEAYKRDVDRTLLRENLNRTVDERLRSLVEMQKAGHELQRAVRARGRRR